MRKTLESGDKRGPKAGDRVERFVDLDPGKVILVAAQPAVEYLLQQVLLVLEVMVDGAARGAGAVRDILKRSPADTPFPEQAFGGVQ